MTAPGTVTVVITPSPLVTRSWTAVIQVRASGPAPSWPAGGYLVAGASEEDAVRRAKVRALTQLAHDVDFQQVDPIVVEFDVVRPAPPATELKKKPKPSRRRK